MIHLHKVRKEKPSSRIGLSIKVKNDTQKRIMDHIVQKKNFIGQGYKIGAGMHGRTCQTSQTKSDDGEKIGNGENFGRQQQLNRYYNDGE